MIAITRVAGKPHITPRLDAMWHRGIAGTESGVFEFFESFKAEISSNNKIRIRSGIGMLQGRYFAVEPSTYDEVSIGNGTQGEKRIDLIVARWTVDDENNVQDGDWHVIQGTPTTGTPAVPAHTTGDLDAGDLIADMPMFQVELNGVNITAIKKVYKTWALPIAQGGTGKTTAVEALKALGGANIKRVYSNASPGSAFPAQTVSNNMGGYPKYFVLFGYGSSPCALAIVEKNKKTPCYGIISAAAQRTITINENNFVVTIGEMISGGWQTNNNAMVPLEIYGMEGVL